MITSTMQDDFQLTVPAMLEHGTRVFGRSECVTWQGDGARRATFAEIGANARRLAGALAGLGVQQGDRVATLCWNSQEHLEAYVVIGDGDTSALGSGVPVHSYADLFAGSAETFEWPAVDERAPASMCYTSGTTAGYAAGDLHVLRAKAPGGR